MNSLSRIHVRPKNPRKRKMLIMEFEIQLYNKDQIEYDLEIESILKKSYIYFSYTYDGICIVSQRVIDFIFRFQYENDVEWVRLKNFPNFYTFLPHRSVEFDSDRRQTRFEKQCKICGFYESVTRGYASILKRNLKSVRSRLL